MLKEVLDELNDFLYTAEEKRMIVIFFKTKNNRIRKKKFKQLCLSWGCNPQHYL